MYHVIDGPGTGHPHQDRLELQPEADILVECNRRRFRRLILPPTHIWVAKAQQNNEQDPLALPSCWQGV